MKTSRFGYRASAFILLTAAFGLTQQASVNHRTATLLPTTLFVSCQTGEKPKHVRSLVALSEDGNQRCSLRVADAGFSEDKNADILVRARLSTALELDETEKDVAPKNRCGNAEETWSFNFANGEIRKV